MKKNELLGQEKLVITESYIPKDPPKFTDEELKQFREIMKDVRTDGENLRFDEKRQMFFYPPKQNESPQSSSDAESVEEYNGGCLLF